MAGQMAVDDSRIQFLNHNPVNSGKYVLYWMQQSQRVAYNHALSFAIRQANALNLPVVVAFGLTADYPEANRRHYAFMLEGLREVAASLRRRGIRMVIRREAPTDIAVALAGSAAMVVTDRGYLRHQVKWRHAVARAVTCRLVQVESDVVVPVEVVSGKAEYSARTIRPKIHKHLNAYLRQVRIPAAHRSSLGLDVTGISLTSIDGTLDALGLSRDIGTVRPFFTGGTAQAKSIFSRFVDQRLAVYDQRRSHPEDGPVSAMSPYLHFGQVSPVYLALQVQKRGVDRASTDAFLEQLIVRRELAVNFVRYTPRYDRYDALPAWARQTLEKHRRDRRQHVYTRKQLETAATHDPYWNAAMTEMRTTGYMHNTMRMYWGKRVLAWSRTPQDAFETLLALNNRYFLDGRDPNSYAGVAWIFGAHDRPWPERDIFGTVRTMVPAGLRRKYDIGAYVKKHIPDSEI